VYFISTTKIKKLHKKVVRGLMGCFVLRSRGLSDKVIAGEVVSNFLAVVEKEVHYLLHKNPSRQTDSVRVFALTLTTIKSNIILTLYLSGIVRTYVQKQRRNWIKCNDLTVLLHEEHYIDLMFQQAREILHNKLLTEILQANIMEW
jgi:hypothetical protein